MWQSFMCVSLVCGLALDSNTIRSSREMAGQSSELLDRSHGDQVERSTRRRTDANSSSHRESPSSCSSADCFASQSTECSNRAQRRPSGQAERQRDQLEVEQRGNTDGFNRTKAPEMSGCVRSGDCAAGLCCVRYLTGKRCQRIPVEGEACLLRGFNKQRRKLGRCDCDAGLSCAAVNRSDSGKNKGQGVCRPRHGGQRTAGHSGKKRRTAESSC